MSEDLKDMIPENEPSSFRLIITLGIAGFVSGLILVGTYMLTKPIIAANKAEALQKAIFEVLPNTNSFLVMLPDGESLRELAKDEEQSELVIYMGLNSAKELTGFAIPGGEPGYQDIIGAIYGYDPIKKRVIGFKILDSKETPGLGDKIFKDLDFQKNFLDLEVNPEILVIKKGERTAKNQIEAITGATISSKAIGRLLNKSVKIWQAPIEKYLDQNKRLSGDGK